MSQSNRSVDIGTIKSVVRIGACVLILVSDAGAFALTPQQSQAKELFRELIETNTTHATGQTTAAARTLANRLVLAGLPQNDVQVLEEFPGKGNLVARLRSKRAGD